MTQLKKTIAKPIFYPTIETCMALYLAGFAPPLHSPVLAWHHGEVEMVIFTDDMFDNSRNITIYWEDAPNQLGSFFAPTVCQLLDSLPRSISEKLDTNNLTDDNFFCLVKGQLSSWKGDEIAPHYSGIAYKSGYWDEGFIKCIPSCPVETNPAESLAKLWLWYNSMVSIL
jgi:hypothetical protein